MCFRFKEDTDTWYHLFFVLKNHECRFPPITKIKKMDFMMNPDQGVSNNAERCGSGPGSATLIKTNPDHQIGKIHLGNTRQNLRYSREQDVCCINAGSRQSGSQPFAYKR